MKIIDLPNPERINRKPDKIIDLLSSGKFSEQEFVIKSAQLRLYIEKIDDKLGPYSLITSLIETDKGSIEMMYEEGFRGKDSLEESSNFLQSNLGLSGLILRSIIALKEGIKKKP